MNAQGVHDTRVQLFIELHREGEGSVNESHRCLDLSKCDLTIVRDEILANVVRHNDWWTNGGCHREDKDIQ